MKRKGRTLGARTVGIELSRMTDGRRELLGSMRKTMGLPLAIVKERNCLKCERLFLSENSGHRMCANCGSIRSYGDTTKISIR